MLLILVSSCFVAPAWLRPMLDEPFSPLSLLSVLFFAFFVTVLLGWYFVLTFLVPLRTTYFVTDLRLVFSLSFLFRLERSVALADITNVTLLKGRGTRGSIAFGVPAGAFMRHLSILDLVRLPPIAFHNIVAVDEVYRLIVNAKKQDGSSNRSAA